MCARITIRIAALILSICLALTLCLPVIPAAAPLAYGDELSDSKAALDEAQNQLNNLSNEYNALQAKAADLEAQVADAAAKAEAAQQSMAAGQRELGATMVASYKEEASSSVINVFLASQTLQDFIRNMAYYNSIEEQKAQMVAEQKKLNETYTAALEDLDRQKNEQEKLVEEAAAKKSEAEKVVSDAAAKVSSIKSEQARIAQMQDQAAALQEKQAPVKDVAISDKWNTNTDRSNQQSSSSSSSKGNSDNSASSSAPSGGGWKTGIASAYGGSSDKSTGNPAYTANGSICNDTSMGVAVPMSWPDWRSYLGKRIEIRYNGKTVIATINDCGGFGKYGRDLDLQPGVFKAFGFSTCQAWGARTVSYRIL